ncbi:hypothetical protein RE2895_61180 (plasmid) [Rhodococcus erythropolis]|nr:hypothetical protein RE2895_61180 [Rhodococcus erythropolis]
MGHIHGDWTAQTHCRIPHGDSKHVGASHSGSGGMSDTRNPTPDALHTRTLTGPLFEFFAKNATSAQAPHDNPFHP